MMRLVLTSRLTYKRSTIIVAVASYDRIMAGLCYIIEITPQLILSRKPLDYQHYSMII